MARTAANLDWVVCHATTRLVLRHSVACPTRGRVPGLECLGCRYLMTSSLERSEVMWCEARGPVAILRGALQGRAPKLEPDRLAAGLERVAAPRQAGVLEQRVDRMVAGQHGRLEGGDPAAAGRDDRGIQQPAPEAASTPRLGDRHGDLLRATVAFRVQRLEAEMPDDYPAPRDRHPAVRPALARPGESSSLHGADLAGRAEEAAAPALGAERGVERRDGWPVIPADVADARSRGVHVVSMGRTTRRARVPFALPEPADRSAPVGPSVTRQ